MSGFFALLRFVSLRHLVSARLRSLLTLLGVALGVSMVVGTSASNAAVLRAFDELGARTSGKSDLEVRGDESGVGQGLVDELAALDVVAHVAGRTEQTTILKANDATVRVLVLGVDFLGDLSLMPFDAGARSFTDPLELLNDPHAILVSDSLARAHRLSPGSTVRLRTAHGVEEFHVEAVLAEDERSRVFGGQVVVLSIDAAQLAFSREGRVDRIDVQLRPEIAFDDGKRAVDALLGDRAHAERPTRRAAQLAQMTAAFTSGLSITGALAVLIGMFLVYNAVAVSVAQRRREIGVLRALGVSRARVLGVFLTEAAILGAVGGVLGVLVGSLMARAVVAQFGENVSRFFENIAPPHTEVTPRLAAIGVALGVFATVVASLVPARAAARVTPIEALRSAPSESLGSPLRRRALFVVGALSIASGLALTARPSMRAGLASVVLVFFGAACVVPSVLLAISVASSRLAQRLFGVSVRLGVENVPRALGRSALTVAALMVAAALSLTMSTYTHSYEVSCLSWVEASIPADVFVSAGSPLANDRNVLTFSPRWADAVRAVEGVAAVDQVRSLSVPYTSPSGGLFRLEVLSLDSSIYLGELAKLSASFDRVVAGPRPIPPDALSKSPSVLVSENLAFKLGLSPGDSIELPSPTGAHRFVVVASVVDYSSDQGLLIVDRRYALEYFGDPSLDSLHVYLQPGRDPLVVAAAIRSKLSTETGGDEGLFVTTNAALKDEIRTVIRQTFGVSKASEAIALLVAVLGVIGTMIAAVVDRRRELGVLRAIGARRVQVTTMLAVEAAMLGLSAALLAVAASIPASLVFVDVISVQASGWHVAFRVPWAVVFRVVLGSVLLAALSGLIPGIRASRAPLTEGLSHE